MLLFSIINYLGLYEEIATLHFWKDSIHLDSAAVGYGKTLYLSLYQLKVAIIIYSTEYFRGYTRKIDGEDIGNIYWFNDLNDLMILMIYWFRYNEEDLSQDAITKSNNFI